MNIFIALYYLILLLLFIPSEEVLAKPSVESITIED